LAGFVSAKLFQRRSIGGIFSAASVPSFATLLMELEVVATAELNSSSEVLEAPAIVEAFVTFQIGATGSSDKARKVRSTHVKPALFFILSIFA
jgi:hypothetical protein